MTISKFLIVDDEPDMCWALHHILEKNGFAAVVGFTAQEALAQMASNGFLMAFLDAKLPDMDGLELARRIRLMDSRRAHRNDIGILLQGRCECAESP